MILNSVVGAFIFFHYFHDKVGNTLH